jgi:hypothetical protein
MSLVEGCLEVSTFKDILSGRRSTQARLTFMSILSLNLTTAPIFPGIADAKTDLVAPRFFFPPVVRVPCDFVRSLVKARSQSALLTLPPYRYGLVTTRPRRELVNREAEVEPLCTQLLLHLLS